jgi:transcriptional regulator with XRE-family HTH domain
MKVVPIKATMKGTSITSYEVPEAVMNDLRLRLYEFDSHSAAERMGVSEATYYAIRANRTKWPRPKTFFALLKLLEIEMRLYDVKSQEYL